jgi:Trm5-related predicted tRNA methylase
MIMKAIEINSKTNKKGHLKLDLDLKEADKNVKVLILLEEEINDENEWLKIISNNPGFDFLKDEEEDIYSLKDGKAI